MVPSKGHAKVLHRRNNALPGPGWLHHRYCSRVEKKVSYLFYLFKPLSFAIYESISILLPRVGGSIHASNLDSGRWSSRNFFVYLMLSRFSSSSPPPYPRSEYPLCPHTESRGKPRNSQNLLPGVGRHFYEDVPGMRRQIHHLPLWGPLHRRHRREISLRRHAGRAMRR